MASSHPIQVEVFSADEVSEIFDAISYYKGASVIRQVFDWIGPEAFQTGLQAYLTKFQYKNTVTDDLWAAWGEASGKPVAGENPSTKLVIWQWIRGSRVYFHATKPHWWRYVFPCCAQT